MPGIRTALEPTGGLAAQMRDDAAVLALRALVIMIAVAACAWFALGVRSSHEVDLVSSRLASAASITPAQARSYDHALRNAAILNPDQTIETLRAEVALHAGRHATALSIAERIVRRERENPYDWLRLEVISAHVDPALNRLAQTKIGQLVPPVGTTG